MNFNELIPKSSVLLQCKEQQLCSLIMISIPDHLKKSQQQPAIEQKDYSEVKKNPAACHTQQDMYCICYGRNHRMMNFRH